MKNFFKFKPSQKKEKFRISDANATPTLSKEKEINSSLEENKTFLEKVLHYPTSNDIQFRYFDIKINDTSYSSLLVFYDGLVDSTLINGYLLKQLMLPHTIQVENKSVIKNKNVPDLKAVISRKIISRISGIFCGRIR